MFVARRRSLCLLVLTVALLVNSNASNGATLEWERSYPGIPWAIAGNPNEGVLLVGWATDEKKALLFQHDSSGTLLWSASFLPPWPGTGELSLDFGPVTVDQADNVYITMEVGDGDNSYLAIAKYGSRGHKKWARRMFSRVPWLVEELATDPSENLYVAGVMYKRDMTAVFLAKYTRDGTREWMRTFGPGSPATLTVDAEGNIVLVGLDREENRQTVFTHKYSPDGTRLWSARLKGGTILGTASAVVDPSCNVYVAATLPSVESDSDILLVKYDRNGVRQWRRTYDGPAHDDDDFVAMARSESGDLFILGSARNADSFKELLLLKLNSDGVPQWKKTYARHPGLLDFNPSRIVLDAEDNSYISACSGDTGLFSSSYCSKYLVTYSANGEFIASIGMARAPGRDGAGNIYSFRGSDEDQMFVGKLP